MNRGIERNNLIPSSSKSEHFELFLYDPLYNRPCVLLFITGFTPRLKLLWVPGSCLLNSNDQRHNEKAHLTLAKDLPSNQINLNLDYVSIFSWGIQIISFLSTQVCTRYCNLNNFNFVMDFSRIITNNNLVLGSNNAMRLWLIYMN